LNGAATYSVDFAMAASQNFVCITQQMCHILILFHNYFVLREKNNLNLMLIISICRIILILFQMLNTREKVDLDRQSALDIEKWEEVDRGNKVCMVF